MESQSAAVSGTHWRRDTDPLRQGAGRLGAHGIIDVDVALSLGKPATLASRVVGVPVAEEEAARKPGGT